MHLSRVLCRYLLMSTAVTLYPSTWIYAIDSSMTVVAPGPVSSLSEIEARVSIRNTSSTSQTFNLNLYVDAPFGTAPLGSTQSITVGANEQVLYRQWVPTSGFQGPNDIRYTISGGGVADMTGSQTIHITSKATTRSVPLATVGWFEPGSAMGIYPGSVPPTEQDVRNALDDAKAIGINTIVVAYADFLKNTVVDGNGQMVETWGTFYDSQYLWENTYLDYHVLDTVMSQAEANDQKVYLGLGRGFDETVLVNGLNDQNRLDTAIAHQQLVATELWGHYHDSPSLAGWYIPLETSDVDQASTKFYNAVVDFLRTPTIQSGQPVFRADLPVMVSPAALPTIDQLENSKVDIFNYQDSVGAGFNNTTADYEFRSHDRTQELAAIFTGYEDKHDEAEAAGQRKHLWANLEAWEMDGCNSHPSCAPTDPYGSPYPATPERALSQLGIEANYVDAIMINEIFGFMEAPNRSLNRFGTYLSYWGENHTAKNLYSGYQQYFEDTWPTLEQSQQVANGQFEDGTTNWLFGGNGSTQSVSTSSDTPNGYGESLRLDIDSLDGAYPLPWVYQEIPVVGGQEYLLSAWAKKINAPSGQLALQLWMLDSSGAIISGNTLALFFSSSSWELKSQAITAASNAESALILISAQDSSFGFGLGEYLIDYVSLLGATAPGSGGGGGVPEPSTGGLLILACIFLGALRAHRKG